MPINVGEVEAVLSAKDGMSPAFIQAAKTVDQLRNILKNLGDESPAEIKKVETALERAEAAFEAIRDSGQTAATSIDKVGAAAGSSAARLEQLQRMTAEAAQATTAQAAAAQTASTAITVQATATQAAVAATAAAATTQAAAAVATEAGAAAAKNAAASQVTLAQATEASNTATKGYATSMQQVEGIAIRLAERLVILMALRGAFQFTADIFESAGALVKLNEQSDISLGTLEKLQSEATSTSVPFTEVSKAVLGFEKTIAESKPQTIGFLHDLKINTDEFFAASSNAKWQMVINAISGIKDPLERARIEQGLLKTEGLDPLITSGQLVTDQLNGTKGALDNQVTALSNATKGWWSYWASVKNEATREAGNAVIGAGYLLGMNPGDLPGLRGQGQGYQLPGVNRALGGGTIGDISLDGGRVGPEIPGPKTSWDKLTDSSLTSSLNSLTRDQWNMLEMLRENTEKGTGAQLTPENAGQIVKIDADQYKEYMALVAKWKSQASKDQTQVNKFNEAMREAAVTGRTPQETLDTIDGNVVEGAKSLITGGMEPSKVATIYGLVPPQMKAIEDSMREAKKAGDEYDKDTERVMKDIQKWTGEAATFAAAAVGDSFDKQRAAADAEFNNREYELSKADIDTKTFEEGWAAAAEVRQQKIAAIDAKEAASTEAKNQRKTDSEARAAAQNEVLWDKYYSAVEQESGTALDIQLANIRKQQDQAIKGLKESGDYTASNLQAIYAYTDQMVRNAIRSYDPLWIAWKQGNEDMRKEWANTWDQALSASDDKLGKLVDAVARPLDDISTMFRKMMAGVVADWESKLLSPILNDTKKLMGQMFGVDSISGAGSSRSGGVNLASGIPTPFSAGQLSADLSNPNTFIGPTQNDANIQSAGQSGMSTGSRIAGGAMMAVAGGYQMSQNQSYMGDIMGGMEAGAGVGTMIAPGVGTLVGMVIGGAAGFLERLFTKDQTNDLARDAGEKFGQQWSDALTKKVKDNAKSFHDEVTGELVSLPDIMKDNPVTAANIGMYEDKVHDLFSMIDQGHLTTTQVGKELTDLFPTIANAATDAYGRIDNKLRGLIQLNKEYGTNSQAIADWQKGQGSSALSGFVSVMGATSGAGVAPHDKTELGDLGMQAVGSYVAAVATGTSKVDALKAESDALTKLEKEYKDLGVTVEDAQLKELFFQNDLYKSGGTLLTGIDGLSKEMANFDNIGYETADMFAAQEKTGYGMYVRIQNEVAKLGGGTKEALQPMQGYLHSAEEEAKKLGVPLDENTKMMIEQSKQLGIWDEKAGDAVNPTKDLANAIKDLVNWLKSIPSNVHSTVTVDQHTTTTDDSSTGSSAPSGNREPDSIDNPEKYGGGYDSGNRYETGGVVYAAKGRVINFKPMGTDRVPAMLTPDEGIVSVPGMNRIGSSGLNAINSGADLSGVFGGGGGSSDTYNVNVAIHTKATNGRELATEARAPGGLIDVMIQEIARNKRGRGTILKRGLEVA